MFVCVLAASIHRLCGLKFHKRWHKSTNFCSGWIAEIRLCFHEFWRCDMFLRVSVVYLYVWWGLEEGGRYVMVICVMQCVSCMKFTLKFKNSPNLNASKWMFKQLSLEFNLNIGNSIPPIQSNIFQQLKQWNVIKYEVFVIKSIKISLIMECMRLTSQDSRVNSPISSPSDVCPS